MEALDVLDIARDALLMMLFLSGPLLLTALVLGFLISLVQALTQIQEMTLTFVPKILGVFFVMLLSLPFMSSMLENFSHRLFDKIVHISRK